MENLKNSFAGFYRIIKKLRSENGCPWDRKQTAKSLRTNLLEEAYECIEAISEENDQHTAEELGDVLLLVAMIARIKEEENAFTFEQVITGITEKLVRRHPHVFADTVADTAEEVKKNWEYIKQNLENRGSSNSMLDGISAAMPPLERAYRLQKKASKGGFDWPDRGGVWEKVKEEIGELGHEIESGGSSEKLEEELGDIIFSIVNLARFLKIDPAVALHRTNEKFLRRFRAVEEGMREKGIEMAPENLKEMDIIWNSVKSTEK